jgi:hypothetical protein
MAYDAQEDWPMRGCLKVVTIGKETRLGVDLSLNCVKKFTPSSINHMQHCLAQVDTPQQGL